MSGGPTARIWGFQYTWAQRIFLLWSQNLDGVRLCDHEEYQVYNFREVKGNLSLFGLFNITLKLGGLAEVFFRVRI